MLSNIIGKKKKLVHYDVAQKKGITFTQSKLYFPAFAVFESKKLVYINLRKKNINGLMIFLQISQAPPIKTQSGKKIL